MYAENFDAGKGEERYYLWETATKILSNVRSFFGI